MVAEIERLFPHLHAGNYRVTSPAGDAYNCIAWAAGDTANWWWPDDPSAPDKGHWPQGVVRAETLAAFQDAFATLGYIVCPDAALEVGCEKVAVFADPSGAVTHAARQLASGRWTSKLGLLEDIEHDLSDLEGAVYGSVQLLMKRSVPSVAAP
jgi:hypothetical protein